MLFFLEESSCVQLPLEGTYTLTPCRRSVCLHELLGIFLHEGFLFSPTYEFLSVWTHGYLLSTLVYYPIQLYFISQWFGHQGLFHLAPMFFWHMAIRVRFIFIYFCVLFVFLSHLLHPTTHAQGSMLPWFLVSQWHCFLLYKTHTKIVRNVGEFSLSFNILLYIIYEPYRPLSFLVCLSLYLLGRMNLRICLATQPGFQVPNKAGCLKVIIQQEDPSPNAGSVPNLGISIWLVSFLHPNLFIFIVSVFPWLVSKAPPNSDFLWY